MEAMTVAQRMTAQEFLAWEDGPRWTQLIDGEVVRSQPDKRHHDAQRELGFVLEAWTREAPDRGELCLPLDVRLEEGHVYAPDLLWYRSGRVPGRHDPPPYPIPDLAAEVRSPSTWRFDIGVKKSTYERHGLPELWLVDTAADEVLIFRRSMPSVPIFDVSEELARGDTLTSPLLPGFTLALDALFA
jgi:Uma2 family endonuclease